MKRIISPVLGVSSGLHLVLEHHHLLLAVCVCISTLEMMQSLSQVAMRNNRSLSGKWNIIIGHLVYKRHCVGFCPLETFIRITFIFHLVKPLNNRDPHTQMQKCLVYFEYSKTAFPRKISQTLPSFRNNFTHKKIVERFASMTAKQSKCFKTKFS